MHHAFLALTQHTDFEYAECCDSYTHLVLRFLVWPLYISFLNELNNANITRQVFFYNFLSGCVWYGSLLHSVFQHF